MGRVFVALVGTAALLWACGGPSSAPIPAPVAVDPNLAPEFRLGDASVPTAYGLKLQIDPSQIQFTGEVTIDVQLAEPLHTLWLHKKELTIYKASFLKDGRTIALRETSSKTDSQLLGLASTEELPAGPGKIQIQFSGELGRLQALFRQFEDGRWYAYSDFEATDARAAFPCYDEPRFKVPWRIEVRAPKGSLAFANTAEVSRKEIPEGGTIFRFAESPPLPSYLVAVAVGPFDLIEGKASNTPLRIIAPKGQAKHGHFVLESTGHWIRYLESYLDMPMPFAKLDFIAVPHFGGAMENPGLVTFSSNILLSPPGASQRQLRRSAGVTAHELAHMWFGNLLTPRDWDDLWLNEAFATWLSDKVVANWQPERRREVLDIADKSTAYESDHEIGGRMVRQPIHNREDIRSAFDSITYRKGGALLTMLEGWLGEDMMRVAVRAYLHGHKGGSVSAPDLVKALRSAAPKKQVGKILKSFLTQAGIPTIEAKLHCGNKIEVELTQSRYLPIASRALASKSEMEATWKIPTCLRYPGESGMARQCVLLKKKKQRLRLRTSTCPQWILPNDQESGYYHYLLDDTGFDALAKAPLDPREQLGLVHNLVAALESGDLGVASSMDKLGLYAPSGSLHVQRALVPLLYFLEQSLVGPAERGAFSATIRQWYSERMDKLGLQSKRGESDTDRQLRPVFIHLLAELGDDRELQDKARAWAQGWLEAPRKMDMQLLDALLQAAAVHGDAALLGSYQAALKKAKDPRHSAVLIGAQHAFADPALLQEALEQSIPSKVGLPNLIPVLMRTMARPALRKRVLAKFAAEREALLAMGETAKASDEEAPEALRKRQREKREKNFERLTPIFARLCDAEGKAFVQRFAGDKLNAKPIIEVIDGCMDFAAAQKASASSAWASVSK